MAIYSINDHGAMSFLEDMRPLGVIKQEQLEIMDRLEQIHIEWEQRTRDLRTRYYQNKSQITLLELRQTPPLMGPTSRPLTERERIVAPVQHPGRMHLTKRGDGDGQ